MSCEHGGNAVPPEYAVLFRSQRAVRALNGHRGMDAGALALAETLSDRLQVPLISATVTRLLIDLNRSLSHPRVFSEFSRVLDGPARCRLIEAYYEPHRRHVIEAINRIHGFGGRVCHVAVHSFTPRLDSQERRADIGLLYDPGRSAERELCELLKRELRAREGTLRVRRNFPYLGKADGLTTYLRAMFDPGRYIGIEIELNQRLLRRAPGEVADLLTPCLSSVLAA